MRDTVKPRFSICLRNDKLRWNKSRTWRPLFHLRIVLGFITTGQKHFSLSGLGTAWTPHSRLLYVGRWFFDLYFHRDSALFAHYQLFHNNHPTKQRFSQIYSLPPTVSSHFQLVQLDVLLLPSVSSSFSQFLSPSLSTFHRAQLVKCLCVRLIAKVMECRATCDTYLFIQKLCLQHNDETIQCVFFLDSSVHISIQLKVVTAMCALKVQDGNWYREGVRNEPQQHV